MPTAWIWGLLSSASSSHRFGGCWSTTTLSSFLASCSCTRWTFSPPFEDEAGSCFGSSGWGALGLLRFCMAPLCSTVGEAVGDLGLFLLEWPGCFGASELGEGRRLVPRRWFLLAKFGLEFSPVRSVLVPRLLKVREVRRLLPMKKRPFVTNLCQRPVGPTGTGFASLGALCKPTRGRSRRNPQSHRKWPVRKWSPERPRVPCAALPACGLYKLQDPLEPKWPHRWVPLPYSTAHVTSTWMWFWHKTEASTAVLCWAGRCRSQEHLSAEAMQSKKAAKAQWMLSTIVYTACAAYTERMQSCVPHHIHDHFRVSASASHLPPSTLRAFACFRAWAGSYLFAHVESQT